MTNQIYTRPSWSFTTPEKDRMCDSCNLDEDYYQEKHAHVLASILFTSLVFSFHNASRKHVCSKMLRCKNWLGWIIHPVIRSPSERQGFCTHQSNKQSIHVHKTFVLKEDR